MAKASNDGSVASGRGGAGGGDGDGGGVGDRAARKRTKPLQCRSLRNYFQRDQFELMIGNIFL